MNAQAASPTTRDSDQFNGSRTWSSVFTFLTSPQVMLTLPSGNHSLRTTKVDELFTLHEDQPKFLYRKIHVSRVVYIPIFKILPWINLPQMNF